MEIYYLDFGAATYRHYNIFVQNLTEIWFYLYSVKNVTNQEIRGISLVFRVKHKQTSPQSTQDVNWTNIRRSEDFQDVFWTSYVRSVYVLYRLGHLEYWFREPRKTRKLAPSFCLLKFRGAIKPTRLTNLFGIGAARSSSFFALYAASTDMEGQSLLLTFFLLFYQ